MTIQIDLRVPPCAPVPEVARFAALCETAGFDGVGILDSQMLERDVFVSMAAAAQAQTPRIVRGRPRSCQSRKAAPPGNATPTLPGGPPDMGEGIQVEVGSARPGPGSGSSCRP